MTRIVRETADAFWTAPAVTDEQADRETHVPNHAPKTRTRRAKRKMVRQSHGRNRVVEERAETAARSAVCKARAKRRKDEEACEFWESREERGIPMPADTNRNQTARTGRPDERPSVMDDHATYVWCGDDPTVKRPSPPSAEDVTSTIPTQA